MAKEPLAQTRPKEGSLAPNRDVYAAQSRASCQTSRVELCLRRSNIPAVSADPCRQVIQPFGLQTAQNIIALLTSFFAIFLYFSMDTPYREKLETTLPFGLDIGMKTVYLEVFQEIFNFPAITTRKGQWCWYALGPVY